MTSNSGRGLLWLCLLALAGCQSTAPAPERELVEEVRSAAEEENGVIDVFPVVDPAAETLIGQARWLEQEGRLDEAVGRVEAALEISPADPGYWQYLAELKLVQADYSAAIRHAVRSFELGPQIGRLCTRNWLTLSRAYQALDHTDQAVQAETRADACIVRERSRF